MRFSERYGYEKVRGVMQIDSVDEPLRNGLWNMLKIFVWDTVRPTHGIYAGYYLSNGENRELQSLCRSLWLWYFKEPLDRLDDKWSDTYAKLRNYFYECQWYEAYDFVEFVVKYHSYPKVREQLINACNVILEKEMSAYRFIDGVITPITGQHELDEIESSLRSEIGPVREHLRRALELMSDRTSPDFRNSIKEAISAVESLVARVVGEEKGTLGKLLKKLENDRGLHPALRTAFGNLYGYTSDESGIRHALMDVDTVEFSDAKFMLVACSAFVNYVEQKVS